MPQRGWELVTRTFLNSATTHFNMKLEKTGVIKAPIGLVFECLTDIKYLRKEMRRYFPDEKPKLQYNQKDPFGIDNEIRVITDRTVVICTVIDNRGPSLLEVVISPSKDYAEKIGLLNYRAQLEEDNDRTKYYFAYEATKSPKNVPRIADWGLYLFFWIGFFNVNRRFVKYVKSKNA